MKKVIVAAGIVFFAAFGLFLSNQKQLQTGEILTADLWQRTEPGFGGSSGGGSGAGDNPIKSPVKITPNRVVPKG